MGDGPTPRRRDQGQARVGIDGERIADRGEQGRIEDAVAAGMALGQINVVILRPVPDCFELARPPDEALEQAAGVAPVLVGFVPGGDDVVEAHGLGERSDHVGRRRGGQHQFVAGPAELFQILRGERSHHRDELRHGSLAGLAHLVLAPTLGHPGRGPNQAHRNEVLSEAVIDGVEQLVPGQAASLGQHPFVDQGPVQR